MWIMMVKNFQFIQQKQAQCDFAGSDIDKSTLQPLSLRSSFSPDTSCSIAIETCSKKTLALNCQLYSTIRTDKKFASQVVLKDIHTAGDVGLIISHNVGCFGKALVLSYIIKNNDNNQES